MKPFSRCACLALAAVVFVGVARAEDKTPPELQKVIVESIKLLEEKSYGPLLEKLTSPLDKEKIPKEDWERIIKGWGGEKAEFLLKALKNIKDKAPELGDKGNKATYSAKEVGGESPLVFQKTDGKWYLRN